MRRKTNNEFINECISIHADLYDYSLVNYINNKTKVKIICKEHGIFEQTAKDHLNKCRSNNTNNFISRSKDIHSNLYDYSLVNYINNKTKVKIICKEHGIFEQNPSNHLLGSGCPTCSHIRYNTKSFIKKSIDIHSDLYNYKDLVFTSIIDDVNIICKKHGMFKQKAYTHIAGHGCPKCCTSKGELSVEYILNDLNIKYITQYKFNDCKNKRVLPFDFYLPDYNICIEYDGKQHFEVIFSEKSLLDTQRNDKIKNEYCLNNNINLIRIRYDENIKEKIMNMYVKI
jgi:very-short-patch-repair endonuclease